jgi:hypothetical protein
MLKIDHVALITPNLAATAWQLRTAGLTSIDGGFNIINENGVDRPSVAHYDVPLGHSQYIEVEQFVDTRPADEPDEDFPRTTLEFRDRAVREGPFLIQFWVYTDDFDSFRNRIGAEQLHRRHRPDGVGADGPTSRTSPRTIDAIAKGLPAFFEFFDPSIHPGRIPMQHPDPAAGIAWVEVGTERASMEDWLGPEAGTLPLRYVDGPPGVLGVGVALECGDVIEIRPSGGPLLDLRRVENGR